MPHTGSTSRARRLALLLLSGLVVSGCGGGTSGSTTFSSVMGWRVQIPAGWHELMFGNSRAHVSAEGVMVSNVSLRAPSLAPGSPVQANGRGYPENGVAIVIASDRDPRLAPRDIASLPLHPISGHGSRWTLGSALGGQPYLATQWFRAGGKTFVAVAKIGAKASPADLRALDSVVSSLRAS